MSSENKEVLLKNFVSPYISQFFYNYKTYTLYVNRTDHNGNLYTLRDVQSFVFHMYG